MQSEKSEIIIYNLPDGRTKIDVKIEEETVWLTQNQMAELFQTTRSNITMHIRNVFEEGELEENSVCKDFLLTASDGKNYKTKHYNLFGKDYFDELLEVIKEVRLSERRLYQKQLIFLKQVARLKKKIYLKYIIKLNEGGRT